MLMANSWTVRWSHTEASFVADPLRRYGSREQQTVTVDAFKTAILKAIEQRSPAVELA